MMGFSKYNESLRQSRKLMHRNLRPAAIATYRPVLQTKTHVLLTQLLANPGNFEDRLYQFVTFPLAPKAFTEASRQTVQPDRIPNPGHGLWLRSQGAQ
jgi:hypothetical protein